MAGISEALLESVEQRAVEIAIESRWMDVAFSTDGGRVAEHLGYRFACRTFFFACAWESNTSKRCNA
jgi:hypothetical protein